MAESLPCQTLAYRAMARKNWIDKQANRVLPAAYVRRPSPADEDGLSVDVASPQSCAATLRQCYGVASLHVGRIRDIGLDVVVDSAPHAVISEVPRREEDRVRAERFASLLARQSRLMADGA
jgi:hypothetical protein